MTDGEARAPGAAPLPADGGRFRIRAVVFDFDGTLTRPGEIDFVAIHETVGCPRGSGLLEFLDGIADPEERRNKEEVLVAAETAAAERCRANEGAEDLVAFLRENRVPMAIITRNRREAVEKAFANLAGIALDDFALVVTRDLPLKPKPSPDGVRYVARTLGVDVRELLVVGDHTFDVEAGRRAGALTMFLENGATGTASPDCRGFVVATLGEAKRIIRRGLSPAPG